MLVPVAKVRSCQFPNVRGLGKTLGIVTLVLTRGVFLGYENLGLGDNPVFPFPVPLISDTLHLRGRFNGENLGLLPFLIGRGPVFYFIAGLENVSSLVKKITHLLDLLSR
jgi:hypothetical protein